jgi:hypothetical protein
VAEIDEITFTLGEAREALTALDDPAQSLAVSALMNLAEQKAQQARLGPIATFAVYYERAMSPNASSSGIEGWTYTLGEQAEEILGQCTERKEGLSEIEALARDTAGLVHILYTVSGLSSFALDTELLEQAGMDTNQILQTLRQGLIEEMVASGQDRDRATQDVSKLTSLEDFKRRLYSGFCAQCLDPQVAILRRRLQESGINLPELNESGQYDDDDTFEF